MTAQASLFSAQSGKKLTSNLQDLLQAKKKGCRKKKSRKKYAHSVTNFLLDHATFSFSKKEDFRGPSPFRERVANLWII